MDKKDNNKFVDFVVESFAYKTTLNKSFLNRKPYEAKDPKKQFSFLPGIIKEIKVKKGSTVKAGEPILTLESMKMNNVILSTYSGKVKHVNVKKDDVIPKEHLLIEYV